MRHRSRRAFILAAVFFIMVVIILLVASLFRLVPQEVRWSGDHRRDTLAYYAASGGVKHALAWLRQCRLGGGETEPFRRSLSTDPYEKFTVGDPAAWPYRLRPGADLYPDKPDTYFPSGMEALRSKPGRIRLGTDWSSDVFLFPDKRTFPHPALHGGSGTQSPCYILVSLAYRDTNANGVCDTGGGEGYTVRVEAAAVERTFANYAYFVDKWRDQGENTDAFNLFPDMEKPLFSGPVHSNDTPVIRVNEPGRYWSETGKPASFGGELSFSGDPKGADSYDGVAYYGGNFEGNDAGLRPYTGTDPVSANQQRYRRLYSQGQQSIRRTQRVELPTDWKRVAESAWGSRTGQETPVDDAPLNQVFVNKQDLGIAVTGGLKELRLDLVDPEGASKVFDGRGQVAENTATFVGEPALRMTQQNWVYYVSGQETPMVPSYTQTSGSYSYTETSFSEGPGDGGVAEVYDKTVGHTSTMLPRRIPGEVEIIHVPPSGAGPGNGRDVTVTHWQETMVEVDLPITEPATRYVRTEVKEGTGTYTITTMVAGEPVDVIASYQPLDALVSARDHDVVLPVNYLLGSELPPNNQFPVLVDDNEATRLDVTIPAGSTAVLRQDRKFGGSFQIKLLEGAPNGALIVYGSVDSVKGVNRGRRTVLAAKADQPRLKPTALANITLDDEILQYNLTRGATPTSADNGLGIIGANISMSSNDGLLQRFLSRRLHIYASLIAAEGEFAMQKPYPEKKALLSVIGGVVQEHLGRLIDGERGWDSFYVYDRYLPLQPPPAFPADGRYDITFMRVSAP